MPPLYIPTTHLGTAIQNMERYCYIMYHYIKNQYINLCFDLPHMPVLRRIPDRSRTMLQLPVEILAQQSAQCMPSSFVFGVFGAERGSSLLSIR